MQLPSIGKSLPKPNMKNVSQAFSHARKTMNGIASSAGNLVRDEYQFSEKVFTKGFWGATSEKAWENTLAAGCIMLSNVLQYSIGSFGESKESGKAPVKKFEKVKGLILGTVGGAAAGILTRSQAPAGQAKRWIAHAAVLGAAVDLACATVIPPIAEKFGKHIHNKKQEEKVAKQEQALQQKQSFKNNPIVEAEIEQDIRYVEIPVETLELKR